MDNLLYVISTYTVLVVLVIACYAFYLILTNNLTKKAIRLIFIIDMVAYSIKLIVDITQSLFSQLLYSDMLIDILAALILFGCFIYNLKKGKI